MSLQRPSPIASFPPPVSPAAPGGHGPGPCAYPQGLPHRSCFQQHFQGRLHALKQLSCTVLVRRSDLWMPLCRLADGQCTDAAVITKTHDCMQTNMPTTVALTDKAKACDAYKKFVSCFPDCYCKDPRKGGGKETFDQLRTAVNNLTKVFVCGGGGVKCVYVR